jgi:hypothetical protein
MEPLCVLAPHHEQELIDVPMTTSSAPESHWLRDVFDDPTADCAAFKLGRQ